MTDEQVKKFIDGCECFNINRRVGLSTPDYPSYELYTEGLSEGAWKAPPLSDWNRQQLVVNIDTERVVQGFLIL